MRSLAGSQFEPDQLVKISAAYRAAAALLCDDLFDPEQLAGTVLMLSVVRDLDVDQMVRSAVDRTRKQRAAASTTVKVAPPRPQRNFRLVRHLYRTLSFLGNPLSPPALR